ncbi:MAG: response regulator [Burkholderiaceae bacterium]
MNALPRPAPSSLPPAVYLIEDEPVLAEAISFLMSSRGLDSTHFPSGESFWASIEARERWVCRPACIVLDVRMKHMSGLELFDRLRLRYPDLPAPVIFLTGHGDIDMAVDVLKNGAFDFFVKPFGDNRLVDRVLEAIEESRRRIARRECATEVDERLAISAHANTT